MKSGHDLVVLVGAEGAASGSAISHLTAAGIADVVWRGRFVAASISATCGRGAQIQGPACAAETVEADMDLETKMLKLLDGYDGIFQAELRGEYLLDLNLRAYASLSLSVAAAVGLPAIYCAVVGGETVDLVRARPGVSYRWLDGDVRSILWSVRNSGLVRYKR